MNGISLRQGIGNTPTEPGLTGQQLQVIGRQQGQINRLSIHAERQKLVLKRLVFYKGRPPKGIKTGWIMHEYRLLDAWNNSKRKGSMRVSRRVRTHV
jgi:hypothetical protein